MASPQSCSSSEEDTSSDGFDHQEVEKQPLNEASALHDSSEGEESEEDTGGNEVPDGHNVPVSESEPIKLPPKRKAAQHAEPVEPKRMRADESPHERMQSDVAAHALIRPDVPEHDLTKSNVEKLFQVKIDTYEHLGQEVLALEEEHPGFFKSPFLKLPDEKARALNAKLQKQLIEKLKASIRLGSIRKEVTNSLINLID
ncbi:hypothetical protein D1007_07595 [Hordeum vulgare]|nr:hypothetical protein D1007_07595 [Hordeum vulgare]KAI4977642.1 hypothetical protein ZWY2020_014196 [Hordeum vulgare]